MVWLLTKPLVFHFQGSTNNKVGQLLFINIYFNKDLTIFVPTDFKSGKICKPTMRLSQNLEKVLNLEKSPHKHLGWIYIRLI